jgi:hypothetical protein
VIRVAVQRDSSTFSSPPKELFRTTDVREI